MFHFKMFQKFLLPGPICAAAAFAAGKENSTSDVSKAVEGTSKTDSCKHCHIPPKLRPSELPFYGGEQEREGRVKRVVEEPSELEQMIGAMRKELWAFYGQYQGYQLKVLEVVNTGKAHAESSLSFLREEATTVHRAGAIGLGGLGGLVMGLRSGWFKRTVYGAAGAAAMAALCYPRESAEITEQSLQISKYYFTIGYNFICGVKPDGFRFLSSSSSASSTVHSDKSTTKDSTAHVPDQIALSADKQQPPSTPGPVPQVEECSKCKKIPSSKVFSEEIISEMNRNVSASCSCHDPAIGSCNISGELDKLGEMMSDVAYWGFRFVNMGPPCW